MDSGSEKLFAYFKEKSISQDSNEMLMKNIINVFPTRWKIRKIHHRIRIQIQSEAQEDKLKLLH